MRTDFIYSIPYCMLSNMACCVSGWVMNVEKHIRVLYSPQCATGAAYAPETSRYRWGIRNRLRHRSVPKMIHSVRAHECALISSSCLHPTTVSRRSYTVDGLHRAHSLRRSSLHICSRRQSATVYCTQRLSRERRVGSGAECTDGHDKHCIGVVMVVKSVFLQKHPAARIPQVG